MLDIVVRGNSLPDAYHSALEMLCAHGDTVSCKNYDTECRELAMTLRVLNPLKEPRISKLGIHTPESLQQYCMEMLDGVMDWAVDAGLWPYTYHERIARQIPQCVELLKRQPDTRQAVITIRDEKDYELTDPPCLQHIQYMIRDGYLDCFVLFRSNDAVEATFMNAFALIEIQRRMAEKLGVGIGTYTHRANSFHVYKKDYGKLEGYCERICEAEDPDELCYNFFDDWDDLMWDAIPGIKAKIAKMKEGRK